MADAGWEAADWHDDGGWDGDQWYGENEELVDGENETVEAGDVSQWHDDGENGENSQWLEDGENGEWLEGGYDKQCYADGKPLARKAVSAGQIARRQRRAAERLAAVPWRATVAPRSKHPRPPSPPRQQNSSAAEIESDDQEFLEQCRRPPTQQEIDEAYQEFLEERAAARAAQRHQSDAPTQQEIDEAYREFLEERAAAKAGPELIEAAATPSAAAELAPVAQHAAQSSDDLSLDIIHLLEQEKFLQDTANLREPAAPQPVTAQQVNELQMTVQRQVHDLLLASVQRQQDELIQSHRRRMAQQHPWTQPQAQRQPYGPAQREPDRSPGPWSKASAPAPTL